MLCQFTPKLNREICVWLFQGPASNGQIPVSKVRGVSSFRSIRSPATNVFCAPLLQDVCYEFAMLKEEGVHMRSLTSCNGEKRINAVYTSETNQVSVEFVNPNILDTLDTFFMKYEGACATWPGADPGLCESG